MRLEAGAAQLDLVRDGGEAQGLPRLAARLAVHEQVGVGGLGGDLDLALLRGQGEGERLGLAPGQGDRGLGRAVTRLGQADRVRHARRHLELDRRLAAEATAQAYRRSGGLAGHGQPAGPRREVELGQAQGHFHLHRDATGLRLVSFEPHLDPAIAGREVHGEGRRPHEGAVHPHLGPRGLRREGHGRAIGLEGGLQVLRLAAPGDLHLCGEGREGLRLEQDLVLSFGDFERRERGHAPGRAVHADPDAALRG